ncbi:MAG: baseplate J/gp47 family protein [Candidatus Kapabacteria bacterium]|nr:baseplate J/gp47 family protein [Candidatus Kapabacteria bacterium]
MEQCNSTLSIHKSPGTAQNNRLLSALKPDFFLLDERKEKDFILFVQKLSKYINYYNEFDVIDGDWSVFFQKESTSILILIADWKIELLQNSFEILKNEIALNNDSAAKKTILLQYFNELRDEFEKLAAKTNLLDSDIGVKENLGSISVITDKFTFIIKQINDSNDIPALLTNYMFIKGVQQLFGLLLSWKNISKSAIDEQLNNYSKHSPHYALFLAFLKLLNLAREKLNEITKKHLDFYYKDVLHIETRDAKPDYVHLVIEPFNLTPFLIPGGTVFPAGKNPNGQNKFYASTADQTINGIKLHNLLSIHFNNGNYYKSNVVSLNAQNEGFDAFTSNSQLFKEGLMIASPILYLQSGERIIELRFNNDNYSVNYFDFYITGEEKIIEITTKENIEKSKTSKDSYIRLTIPATEKKIVPFDKKIHSDFLVQSSFPVLKIVPKSISTLKSISKVELNIKVNNFKSYIMDSDFGKIDTEKAFYPFGEFPKNGNGVIFSSNEFFMKKNAEASIFLISDSKKTYFYNRTKIFHLNDGTYTEFKVVHPKTKNLIPNLYPLKKYNFKDISSDEIVSNGKFRIELSSSLFQGEAYLDRYIKANQDKTSLPYKPRAKRVIFNYSINETIDLKSRKNENNPIELYKSLPFGYKKFNKGNFIFSKNKDFEGYIYLGFENVNAKDGLSLLVQLEEGTANPLLEPAKVKWEYLSSNVWQEIEPNSIGDETRSLTKSGIVSITIPEYISETNTILASGLFWIRVSVSNIQAICKFIGFHTQALKAVLTDFENSGTVFLENTPKETITKSLNSLIQVKKIAQPYASFDGKAAETDDFLYRRVSERLRHKNRAITTWDYERIVLEEFPEVYRVKSLNHHRFDKKISNVSAGYVTLIPVAKSSATEIINWKPILSLNKMLTIKEHLLKIASPHARISVKPPKLEKVEILFKVKFHNIPGMDSRLYIEELMNIINIYLSPWAYDSTDVNFAGEIEFSSIIQLIDNQSFVNYITDFKVSQYMLDENNQIIGSAIQNLKKITPQTDFTLFVPNTTHQIQEL